MDRDWRPEVEARVRGEHERDLLLSTRTSIRIGGPADLFARPTSPEDLSTLLRVLRDAGVPWVVLGSGSNVLVADRGVRGVVLKLPVEVGDDRGRGARLVFSAGTSSGQFVSRAQRLGRIGYEFIAGVPGTLGGLVAMNAGTPAGEMKDIVTRVELTSADGARWVDSEELGFGYRTCHIPPGAMVTRVEVELPEGDVQASAARMRADLEHRRATQPLDRPTFGSAFRNPPGDRAGRLIDRAGLKGFRIGDAAWSDLHANFVVNLGGATARDVLALLNLARSRVRERFGIWLEPEVRLLGEFVEDERIL